MCSTIFNDINKSEFYFNCYSCCRDNVYIIVKQNKQCIVRVHHIKNVEYRDLFGCGL